MKEVVKRDGTKEHHAAGSQDASGGDMQHAVQHQERRESSVAIDEENCQGGMNQP